MPMLSCRRLVPIAILLGAAACGGAITTLDEAKNDPTSQSASSSPTSSSTNAPSKPPTSTLPASCNVPANHRPTVKTCDDVRPRGPVNTPDNHPHVACTTHEQCTGGTNGRCLGNSHDGWECTYDACQSDADCNGGAGLCECEGGFRSDHNVCLQTECHVDTDCAPANEACGGAGFCSPSLGSCGHYAKAIGYFCHTPKDECTNDSDCEGQGQFGGTPYCKFEPTVGYWKCSTQECAG